ncbi:MAG TPA: NDP-hexose 2,3-dehydratase family protein [Candidatus Cloacimonadota bacterium]|nr:NDP-hexose 2,3-dehydratase family protein [Candidatus Cloacimonadota bacterium]
MDTHLIERIRDTLDSAGVTYHQDTLSALLENIYRNDTEYQDVLAWILQKKEHCSAIVEQIGLNEVMTGAWYFSDQGGDIKHESGGFFKVIGVDVKTDNRESGKGWKQPMVDQGTESSVAGFIRRKREGIHQYLIEAKFEPGNYERVLISPSLQVTYSNLNQAHGGKRPRFTEFFDNSNPDLKCIYSQWMPEDGGRFYLKRVKYMIVEIDDENNIEINDDFRWVSVSTLKRLLHMDNLINPHVRSLLAVL